MPTTPSPAIQSAHAYIKSKYVLKSDAPNVIVLGGDGTFLSACGMMLSDGMVLGEIERMCGWLFGDCCVGRDGNGGVVCHGVNTTDINDHCINNSGLDEGSDNNCMNRVRGSDTNCINNNCTNRPNPNNNLNHNCINNPNDCINNNCTNRPNPNNNLNHNCINNPKTQTRTTAKTKTIYTPNDQNILTNPTNQPLTFYVFNYGHAGYLCLLDKEDLKKEFNDFKFVMQRLSRVVGKGYFVNELMVGRAYPGRLNTFEVHVYDCRCSDECNCSNCCSSNCNCCNCDSNCCDECIRCRCCDECSNKCSISPTGGTTSDTNPTTNTIANTSTNTNPKTNTIANTTLTINTNPTLTTISNSKTNPSTNTNPTNTTLTTNTNTFKFTIKCDSILISTQTGSSAYNRSAKGPIALMQCHIINFINPAHSTNALVVDIRRTIRVRVLTHNGMGVIDGVRWFGGDEFVVRGGAVVRMAYCESGRVGDGWMVERLYGRSN
ncbi:putative ATP-NAD kinase, partial [Trachipleistophora hominis]